jgi:hypothetical protein
MEGNSMTDQPAPDVALARRLDLLSKRARQGRLTEREAIYLDACIDHWTHTTDEWRVPR